MAHTQIVISFDTTGSMSAALKEVRSRISDMILRLKRDIPGVTLSIVAHGDYCDTDTYVTKHQDFSDDEDRLVRFVNDVQQTGGGDAPECYELVLRLVRTELSWRGEATKILIVIGDAYPHPATDPQNKDKIDWRVEAKLLAAMPVKIYGVQIKDDPDSTIFFRTITEISGGSHLKLSEFSTMSDVILAICYRTSGPEQLKTLETEVRARYAPKPLHKDLEAVFAVLHNSSLSPDPRGTSVTGTLLMHNDTSSPSPLEPLVVLSPEAEAVGITITVTATDRPVESTNDGRTSSRLRARESSCIQTVRRSQAAPIVAARSSGTHNGRHPAYFWGEQLTSSSPVTWAEPDDDLHVHSLTLKMVVLDSRADVSETHVVEVQTTGFDNRRVQQPLVTMEGKADSTVAVDVSFNSTVTFRLARGAGPVYLSGQHRVTAIRDAGEEFGAKSEMRDTSLVDSVLFDAPGDCGDEKKEEDDDDDKDDDVVERHVRSLGSVGTVFGIRKP